MREGVVLRGRAEQVGQDGVDRRIQALARAAGIDTLDQLVGPLARQPDAEIYRHVDLRAFGRAVDQRSRSPVRVEHLETLETGKGEAQTRSQGAVAAMVRFNVSPSSTA